MRTRSSGSTDPPTTVTGIAYSATGNCDDPDKVTPIGGLSWTHTFPTGFTTEVMHDTVTPNFRSRMSQGEIINNAYDKTTITETQEPVKGWYEARRLWYNSNCGVKGTIPVASTGGRWVGDKGTQLLTANPSNPSFLATPALSEVNVISRAVTGAWAKTNLADIEGLVVLAEGQKTVQSLCDLAKRAIRIGVALRRADATGLWKQLSPKELADRWMEARYAIRPLVYDIYGFVEALNSKKRNNKPRRVTFRKRESETASATQSGIVTATYSNYWIVKSVKTSTITVQANAGVLAFVKEISEATIWGLNRPFDAVWELVPFSFVVDWFFNVGKVIASWAPAYGLESLASWVVVEKTIEQGIHFQQCELGTWTAPNIWENACRASGGSIDRTTHVKYRVPNPSKPILPVWNIRLDAAKLLDLVIMGKKIFL